MWTTEANTSKSVRNWPNAAISSRRAQVCAASYRKTDGKPTGLMDIFAENNVSVSYGVDSIDTTADRLLVLSPFAAEKNYNIGYAIDSIQGAVTLPQLTQAGLDQLMRVSPDKFFMMVEGGSIDHAGHGNDGGTSVREVIAFNEALQIAYDFYLAHPDETLIVVTADHETGGMSVGCQATGYSVRPDKVAAQKVSKEEFNNYCKGIFRSRMIYTWTDMEDYLRENLGFWTVVDLTPAETEELHRMFVEVFENRNQALDDKTLYANFDGFTSEVFKLLNAKSGFGWTSSGHTGSPVPVYAVGVGAQRFSNLNDNTDLPKKNYGDYGAYALIPGYIEWHDISRIYCSCVRLPLASAHRTSTSMPSRWRST